MMGHSLGAAGAIEAIVCILSLQHDFFPANINFRDFDEGVALDIVTNKARSAPVAIALSNSFGFGGTNASIAMQKRPG
jgi:3-oxoacyl-[acyl-carrier-protein] synthase II